jgi:hypothetical protein
MARVTKAYTQIPMEKLDYIRSELNSKLRKLGASTGEKYSIRTFYLGPRGYRGRNTTRTDAYAAKIGIYKVVTKNYGWGQFSLPELQRYI